MRWIDNLLNRITMYRLVLFYLGGLVAVAVALSFARVLAYDPYAMLFSTAFLLAACAVTNFAFSRVFNVPANVESSAISALILALIISPIGGYGDLWFLFWASVLSMASKYILNIRGKHIFNPVALGVAVTYFAINQSASWWIGSPIMLPFVLAGGLMVARKIRRFRMVFSFLAAALAMTAVGALFSGQALARSLSTLFLYTPYFFFAFVMLTEPLTAPPTSGLRNLYGALVGLLFAPAFHIGSFYTTPELALLIGNAFSYLVSPKTRGVLRLTAKRQIAPDSYEFIFKPSRRLAFAPGQYMEWTLGHADPDSRGNRRYFTLASAPTEPEVRLGVRFNNPSSSYKQALLAMDKNDEITAGQLSGDFTLPRDPTRPVVFIAGGIGITPFRSMVKYLLDTRQARPITLFYGARTVKDLAYREVFDQAQREIRLFPVYVVEQTMGMPNGWVGLVGRITPDMIQKYAPSYRSSIFYISGPIVMVSAVKHMLRKMGVHDRQIKTDFFAGL